MAVRKYYHDEPMQLVPVNNATNDRRFRAAVAAMQGLLAEGGYFSDPAEGAQIAVEQADALLAELDKEEAERE